MVSFRRNYIPSTHAVPARSLLRKGTSEVKYFGLSPLSIFFLAKIGTTMKDSDLKFFSSDLLDQLVFSLIAVDRLIERG